MFDTDCSNEMSNRVAQAKYFDDTICPGVVLFLGGADGCADRVQLSSGTVAAPAVTPDGLYEEGAVIPRPGWRSLTAHERGALIVESCPPLYGNAVSVISLPPQLLHPFRSLRIAAAERQSKEMLGRIIGNESCSRGTDRILAYLRQHFQQPRIDEEWTLAGGIGVRPPRLHTVTEQPGTDALIGLHLDSWYWQDFALTCREDAPNRVCVNIGAEDRYFLFLNVPIAEMYRLVKDKLAIPGPNCPPSSVATCFMTTSPSYPVVRVRIRPGEAYIAPTENIAHDGSSIDMDALDVTLSIRGRFGLCPK